LKAVQKQGAKMQIIYTNQNVHRTFLFTRLDKHMELVDGLMNN
jgi:anti-anti-sigma regulatory factor